MGSHHARRFGRTNCNAYWTRRTAAAARPARWPASLKLMTPAPDRYAVIGHPVAHSLSPWIHAQFAQQSSRPLIYSAIDVPSPELALRVREFFAQGGCGLNVTVPHKQAVLQLI